MRAPRARWFFLPWGKLGILLLDKNDPILFSERYGYCKVWRFGPLKIKWYPKS